MPDQARERLSVAKARALVLIDDYVANLEQNRASSPSAASDTTTSTTSSATLSPTDNPATPIPGSATHPASYQPPHSPSSPSLSPDDQTATAISDEQVRHHLQQYLFGHHQQQQPVRAQTPAPQHHSPTMSPHQPLAAAAAPLLPFAHTHRRAHLHPHERLAADIPRRRLHPRQPPPALAAGYIVPAARGSALADDVTDYIASQAWASAANLPVGLGWLEQPGFVVKENYSNNRNEHNRPVPLLRDPLTRRVAEGVLGQPLYDLPILGGAAGRISTQVEAWRVAMWLCYDGRVTLHDVSARMRVVRTQEQLRVVEDALAVRVVAWCEEHAGMMFHCPVVTERDVRLVGELGEEKVMRNVRWDLWRRVPQRGVEEKEKEYEARKEAEPVFVAQPRETAGEGGGGLGAMWRALSKKEGRCYGEKAAVALGEWQDREKERLMRVPQEKKVDVAEYKPEGWLFGTGAPRERPNPWDMANMSRDPDWALRRWNVEPFIIPTIAEPRLQHNTGAGLHSPYLNGASPTVATGVFPHPYGQPPDNTSNAGHSPPGSAGPPMQNFTAQASPHLTVSSASPHTPQMFIQSPVQQAPQPTPESGPQIQSNAAMGLGLSNINLPNTAQSQHQSSTPTVPAAIMSPNPSTTMQSPSMSPQSAPASVGQQQPSGPFTPLHHAQARPTPATAPVTRFVNMDQESYGRFESQGLVQANADAPTRNAGDSLWPNHFRPPSAGPGT